MLTECRTNIKMCITATDASSQDHLTLTSLWSLIYTTCSLFIGPIQFSGVCLLFSWLRRFCLYLSAFHQANSPDLAHVHLAICKQSKIGCGLISRYWIFWRTNTLLLTKGQKHHKGLRESVCISAKGLYLPCWLNKTLTWMILSAPFTYFDRKKEYFQSAILTISHLISDHCLSLYITDPIYVATWKRCWYWLQCYRVYTLVLCKSCQCHKVPEVVERYCSLSTVNTSKIRRRFSCRVKGFNKWICRYANQMRIKEMPFISVFKHATSFLRDFFVSHCAFSF